ncbi:hypothetical protein ACSBPU_15930 [Parapusillimonas sp. JC17]
MTARPGRIHTRIDVPIDRPRTIEDTTTKAFNELKREILKQIRH